MSGAFTSKNYSINRAPKRIELFGDKKRRIESAQHIIEFPGGAIEVSRTSSGAYWAHIIVNQNAGREEGSLLQQARGDVVFSSLLRSKPTDVASIDGAERLSQVAVLIQPKDGAVPGPERAVRAQHAIFFPGGVVELNKAADKGFEIDIHITGEVIGSRLQRADDAGVSDIEEATRLTQVSMHVKPVYREASDTQDVSKAKAA